MRLRRGLTLMVLMLVVAACSTGSPPQTQQPAPPAPTAPPVSSTSPPANSAAPPPPTDASVGDTDAASGDGSAGGGGAPGAPLVVVDGGPPWLRMEVTDLRRIGTTVTVEFIVHVEDRVLQPATRDVFSSADDQGSDLSDDVRASVSGVTLVDEANRNQHVVLRDAEGRCRCTSFARIVASAGPHPHSASFPAPPENVTQMTVEVPHFPAVTVPLRRAE